MHDPVQLFWIVNQKLAVTYRQPESQIRRCVMEQLMSQTGTKISQEATGIAKPGGNLRCRRTDLIAHFDRLCSLIDPPRHSADGWSVSGASYWGSGMWRTISRDQCWIPVVPDRCCTPIAKSPFIFEQKKTAVAKNR